MTSACFRHQGTNAIFFGISQFESDHPGKLNRTAVLLRVWRIFPQLHIPHPAAQTRRASAAHFRPIPRKSRRPRGRTSLLTDSKVRVLPAWHMRLELGNVEFSGGKF